MRACSTHQTESAQNQTLTTGERASRTQSDGPFCGPRSVSTGAVFAGSPRVDDPWSTSRLLHNGYPQRNDQPPDSQGHKHQAAFNAAPVLPGASPDSGRRVSTPLPVHPCEPGLTTTGDRCPHAAGTSPDSGRRVVVVAPSSLAGGLQPAQVRSAAERCHLQ